MNIFFLDKSPEKAAQYQCNKHVIKMILESCQLLCTAHHILGTKSLPDKFYRATHINHPCSKWVREAKENYSWLAQHCIHLCNEYTYRYNKIHASNDLAVWLFCNIPPIKNVEMTEAPKCMPEEFKVENDIVQSYRNYYILDKQKNIKCQWTNRLKPEWLNY